VSILEFEGVRKTYRVGEQEIHALAGIDLRIEEGEFVAIIGPSGSGKSTLMHLLGCLDTPTEGRMVVCGTDLSRATPDTLARMRNREIGFVFQSFNLLPQLDVVANIGLPLVYSGVPRRDQRARALVNNPRIVFGDEPTGNLDSTTGRNILTIFKELHAAGKTIILVTHDPAIAAEAPRVIELCDGRIVKEVRA